MKLKYELSYFFWKKWFCKIKKEFIAVLILIGRIIVLTINDNSNVNNNNHSNNKKYNNYYNKDNSNNKLKIMIFRNISRY